MCIQHLSFICLSVLVLVSACQDDSHRMYVNGNDSRAAGRAKEEEHASLTPPQVLVGTHPNASTRVLSPTPSNGAFVSTGESVHTLQQPSAHLDKKPIEEVVPRQNEKREEASQYSPDDHEAWFYEFVNAVDHVGEWGEIEKVIKTGKPLGYLTQPIAWDDDRYTPLHYAAETDDLEVVKELVEDNNISVGIRTGEYKRTPLHLAASKGNLEVVRYLVDKAADINAVDGAMSSVLQYAALGTRGRANTEVIKFLKSKGACLEAIANNRFSLLHLAIRASNASLVEYLIQEYPYLLHEEVCGLDPLGFAEQRHEREIIHIIREGLEKQQGLCRRLSKGCNLL